MKLKKMMKKMTKRYILEPLNNVKLRKRLVFSSIIINIFLVLIIAFWVDRAAYNQMLKQGSYSLVRGFDQSLSYISSRLENTINISDMVIYNTYLNSLVNKEYTDIIDVSSDARSLRLLVRSFEDNNGIDHARIYLDESLSYAYDGKNIFPISRLENHELLEELFAQKKRKLFVGSSQLEDDPGYAESVLSMFRVMYSTNNYKKIAFVLRLDFPKEEFINILSDTNPTSDSVSFILDQAHTVIASSGPLPTSLNKNGLQDRILSLEDDRLSDIIIDRSKYLILKNGIDLTDWTMVTLVPYSSFLIDFKDTTRMIILISLLTILVSLGLFSLISYTITRRLLVLCQYIKDAETGELVPIDAPVYKDEIGILYQNYNDMIGRIKQLLKENYNMGRDLKSAEYKALQSQINPHFLYNTLDMISWFSLQGKTREVNDIVYFLARFYKISLSKGEDIITIEEELEHADCYVAVQKYRFANKILYVKDIDPDILPYSIPKITIQPLVENAIFHGILEKENGDGILEIKGRMEDGVIHIILMDNGRGMECIPSILNDNTSPQEAREAETRGSHYGLKNIVLRLKLLYGPEYGLSIESTPGKGTMIHLHIPAIEPSKLKE